VALQQIADLVLLGAGGAQMIFPETLEEYECAASEEVPSRIAL